MNGVERSFILSVPSQRDAHTPLPLVFAFHGRTGTPTSLRGYLHVEQAADGGAIFVYPAGLREPVSGTTRTVTHWEIGPNDDDIAFFDALLAHLSQTYCVDLGRLFAVGHSAGAEVTNELGCQRGNVLRAIAPIAGMGPFDNRCTEPPSVWLTHGHADAPVPFHWGEQTRDHWVTAAHCSPEPQPIEGTTCERFVGCERDTSVVFCPHDGDHGPPPFAARDVWAFFEGQR